MNKEEYPVEEKTFLGTDGTQIIITHSNLGRRYRKIGTKLHLMPDPISAKLEDSLTEMIRLQKENTEIDQKLEIEKIRLEARKEIEQLKNQQVKQDPPLGNVSKRERSKDHPPLCVTDVNKTIQVWIGQIAKQLIDNKISVADTPGYIERTLIGTVKLWLHNITADGRATLRNNKDSSGTITTSSIAILDKYEFGIRNEFGSMTTELAEQEKDKNLNRQLMNKLSICNMCYIDEYTCAFKDYYYRAIYTHEEAIAVRRTYFTKLPEPFSTKIITAWDAASLTDTLGARIKYLQTWFIGLCDEYKDKQKLDKVLTKNMSCCTQKIAPQFGCKTKKNKFRYKKRFKKYKSFKSKYKYKNPRKRYYIKNYKRKRPYRPKKKLSECKCYNCGKLGHLAKDCKTPKDIKKKQITEVRIEENIYTELPYIDYDLESNDSIYELDELPDIEINNSDLELNNDDASDINLSDTENEIDD